MAKGKPNMFLFNVEQFRGIKTEELDFGYITHKANNEVFFNIYNVFHVDSINIKTQKGTLVYGALASLRKRRDTFADQLESKPGES